jgi:DNA modification methylase
MQAVKVHERLELIPVEALEPYARNSRTHSAAQIEQLAASMREFGFTNPVLVDETGGIIAGHGRVLAAKSLALAAVPCIRLSHLSDAQKRAYVIADNQLALNAGWDDAVLQMEVQALGAVDFDLSLLGFDTAALDELLKRDEEPANDGQAGAADVVPEPEAVPVTRLGDVWIVGRHRVMCGDSTSADDVARLMAGQTGHLLHADPPYGMGKQADGVANDNLYREKLDEFQMAWWRAFRPHLASNASAYVWGNAPDLWRLWYRGGLADSEVLELRNEIVWDKKSVAGMASPDLTQFPEATERCLFFQFGNQFLGNINIDDFPQSWEPLRSYLQSAAEAAGIKPPDIKRICGVGMYSHWFTRAQFTLIPQAHYATLRAQFPTSFTREWADLKGEWDRVKGTGREVINGKLQGVRAYFDNAHDVMRDVWEFSRVLGDERHGHATPKPVAMMERAIKSALPVGGLCAEPFGGSGSTLMGCETTGRRCFTMELQPVYCDVIVRRWQAYASGVAVLEGRGASFDQIAEERA